jgi:hypothetical protein
MTSRSLSKSAGWLYWKRTKTSETGTERVAIQKNSSWDRPYPRLRHEALNFRHAGEALT